MRLLIFFKTVATYLGLLVLPVNLHMSRNVILPHSFFDLPVLSSFLLFLVILFFTFRCYRRAPLIFFTSTWFFILLLPQAGLFPQNAFLAEHFLYLPSLGFFLLVSYSLLKLFSKKTLVFILIPILAAYGFLTIKRNREWRKPVSFYEKMVRLSPLSFAGHNNLGVLYEQNKLYDKAIKEYKIATIIKEDFLEAYTNMARAHYKKGEQDKAIGLYLDLIKHYPNCDFAYGGLAAIYAENKEYQKAIERYRQAINISGHQAKFYNHLGLIYNEISEFDLAVEEFKKAIAIDNKDPILHNNLGVVYKEKGWLELAVSEYFKALRINPDFAQTHNNLGIVYSKVGQYDQAESYLERAIQIDPDYAEAYYNLGVVYWETGEWDKSRSHWEKVLKLEPGHQLAREWLKRTAN
ncbi:MAG: tetratricopeptide repeat protein [Candidatus Omnitrophota bacterium]|nr:MAG: tetratricopeptide repeat protein [Candidatus Omnitrophota bacterium]